MEKECIKCNKVQNLVEFYSDKSKKDGHSNVCKLCAAKYRSENKDKAKQYRENNKESKKKQHREYMRKRANTDFIFRFKRNIGTLIRNSIRRQGFSKSNSTHKILGCTFEEFKQHIESKFEPWMNWNNYGKYNGQLNFGWDIDHVKPIVLANTEENAIKLNHYKNLQPLCSKINRDIKRGKF